jgi:hypothetical protein
MRIDLSEAEAAYVSGFLRDRLANLQMSGRAWSLMTAEESRQLAEETESVRKLLDLFAAPSA